MPRVSGRPAEMRAYVGRTDDLRETAGRARSRLVTAYDDLLAALPEGHTAAPARPNVAGPLGRTREVDHHVEAVAARFEAAGAPAGAGVYSIDDAELAAIPYDEQYSAASRNRLWHRAEEELARLRENLSGPADDTTVGELVAVLGWMRHEVDTAADPQATAADLIDTMGPGDLQAVERLVAADLDGGAAAATVRGYVGDLATVVSLGLEQQPARARRWVAEIAADHDWYHDGPPQLLVTLAALSAPTTVVLARHVWHEVRAHGHQHVAPESGPMERLTGSTNAIEVLAGTAGDRPVLANAIVVDTVQGGVDGFEDLLAQGGTEHPPLGGDATYEALGRMLTASVDVRLPVEDRLLAASQTLALYDHALQEGPTYHYAPPVQTALGTMTQPLLVHLHPQMEQLVLPGLATNDPANPPIDRLERVVADLAGTEAGTAGLGRAIEGATVELVYESAARAEAARTGDPLHAETLTRTGDVLHWVVGTVAEERVDALVTAVEGGGADAGLHSLVTGTLGATRLEPVAVVIDAVDAAVGDDVVPDGAVLGENPEVRLTYHLTMATLAAEPQLGSQQLLEALQAAANPTTPGAPAGVDGVYGFLTDESIRESDYPGLAELRDHLRDERTLIGADVAATISEVFGV